ncbi:hypothetical protein IN07_03310 [Modestobacter caceresii]|uniref:Uncharacterized protein n=1 Tax=Modestobacter caceresii TaxID=1522368 RepID=A0A098YCQ4_9ACTN|nr:hypothetical protein [Modestobacter caceresii]KGH48244.1 hypothetical protein IN07_03310 [Modestobacter caceresii]
MTTTLSEGAQEARELYEGGLSLRQVGALLGISHTRVHARLQAEGVPMRAAAPRRRHLQLVTAPPPRPAPLVVPPERAAMAFTADRGWHLVQAPPAWMLEMLSELD